MDDNGLDKTTKDVTPDAVPPDGNASGVGGEVNDAGGGDVYVRKDDDARASASTNDGTFAPPPRHDGSTVEVHSLNAVDVDQTIDPRFAFAGPLDLGPVQSKMGGDLDGDSLVRHYEFNGNLKDDGKDEKDGKNMGGVEFDSNSVIYNKLSAKIEANSYIAIPPAKQLGKFSIAIWFRLSKLPTLENWYGPVKLARTYIIILSPHNNFYSTLGAVQISLWYTHDDSGNLVAQLWVTFFYAEYIIAEFDPTVGKWCHLTFTYDKGGNGARLYLDGDLAGSNAYNDISFSDTAEESWEEDNWTIGKAYDGMKHVQPFEGSVQDLRIYNRVLSPDDVTALARFPKTAFKMSYKVSGRNDESKAVMPLSSRSPSTISSSNLDKVHLFKTSTVEYTLPSGWSSKRTDRVRTYLDFKFKPKTIGEWHMIDAYGVQLYVAGTGAPPSSQNYVEDKATSVGVEKSYTIELGTRSGFTVGSRLLRLKQNGGDAESTFGDVVVRLECPAGATFDNGNQCCQCKDGFETRIKNDQGSVVKSSDQTMVDPTDGSCAPTWSFETTQESTSITIHSIDDTTLPSGITSFKIKLYERTSASKRTILTKYDGKTIPISTMKTPSGFQAGDLLPGRRHEIELTPIKKDQSGDLIEMTASMIMQSAVTHCTCGVSVRGDITGKPSDFVIEQEGGYVIFQWKDKSQCEEGFTLSRRMPSANDVNLIGAAARDMSGRKLSPDGKGYVLTHGLTLSSLHLGPDVSSGTNDTSIFDDTISFDYNKHPHGMLFDKTQSLYIDVDLGGLYDVTQVTVWHNWKEFNTDVFFSQTIEVSETKAFAGEQEVVYETGAGNYGPVETAAGNSIVLPKPVRGRFVRHRCGRSGKQSFVEFSGIKVYGLVVEIPSEDMDTIFKPHFPILANGKDCPATPINPGKEAADDLRVSKLEVGKDYVYCVAASARQYMHDPTTESGISLQTSAGTCKGHKILWEASVDGRVTLSKNAGSSPVEDAMISWELFDPNLFDPNNNETTPLKSGDTTTGPSGLFTIKFNEAIHPAGNDVKYPVRVRAAKTTATATGNITHQFICDNETTDCTDTGTLVYLRHLQFNVPLQIIDASSVAIRGKIVVADTDQDNNDDKGNSNSGDGCILQGVDVCLKQKQAGRKPVEELCVKSESDGTYELPATIGTEVTIEAMYEDHTFSPVKQESQNGFIVEADSDNFGHDFKDTTKVDLVVEVAGGLCDHKLGTSTISIGMPGGCKWRADLTQSDFRKTHKAPAQLLEAKLIEMRDDGKRLHYIEKALAESVKFVDLRVMKDEEEMEQTAESGLNATSNTTESPASSHMTSSERDVGKCEEAEEKVTESDGRRVRFQYDGELQMDVKLQGDSLGSTCGLDNYTTTSPCDSLHALETLKFTKPEVKLKYRLKEDLFCDIVEEDLFIMMSNELGTLSTYDKQFWGEYPDLTKERRALLELCSYDSGSCTGQVSHDTFTVTKSLPGAGKSGGGGTVALFEGQEDAAEGNENTKGNDYILRYRLDGNALESSDHTHDGTPHQISFAGSFGPGTEDAGVFYGDAAGFSGEGGDSFIEIPPAYQEPTDLENFSFSIWFRLSGIPTKRASILDFSSATQDTFISVSPAWDCNGEQKLGAFLNPPGWFPFSVCSDIAPAVGQWHHVTFTYEKGGAGVKLYLNGNLVASNSYKDFVWPAKDVSNWYLGKPVGPRHNKSSFKGLMQDLRIYDFALPTSAVKALYEEGQAASTRWHQVHAESFSFRSGGYMFRFNKDLFSWREHEARAQEWGGHLASFHNQSLFDDVLFELKDHGATRNYTSFWVGLTFNNETWQFNDNSTDADYNSFANTYWALGEPDSNSTTESRGYSSSMHNGRFHSAPASLKFPAVYARKDKKEYSHSSDEATCTSTQKENAHIAERMFVVGPPNRSGDHTRSLYIQAGALLHRACVIVYGDYKLKEVGSFGLPTHQPILVLRDPPGGLSYASYENVQTTLKLESKESEVYVGFDFSLEGGIGPRADNSVCGGMGIELCTEILGLKYTIGPHIGGGGDFLTGFEARQNSGGYTTTWSYQTSENPWLAGDKSDAFVIPNLDVKFSQVDSFTWEASTCSLEQDTVYKFNLKAPGNKPALSFVTKYDIETYELPTLQKINASHSEQLTNGTLDTLDETKKQKLRNELARVQDGLAGWTKFMKEYKETNKKAKDGELKEYVPSTWFEKWVKPKDKGRNEPLPDDHWSGLAPEILAGRAVGYGMEWEKEEQQIRASVEDERNNKLDDCKKNVGVFLFKKVGYCEDEFGDEWTKQEVDKRMIQVHKERIKDTHRIKFSGGGGTVQFSLLHHMMDETEEKVGPPHDNSIGRFQFGVDASLDFGTTGFGFDLDIIPEFHIDSTYAHKMSRTKERETSISFTLGDEEESDRFSLDVYFDPRYGTFIFATQGGQSRCPHEAGTDAIAAPKISIVKRPSNHVLPNEWMLFDLELTNEGSDMASLELTVDNNNGILEMDYRFDATRFDRFASKASTTAAFAVRKGPSKSTYDPFKVTFRSVCEGNAGTTGYYSDTAHDTVEVYNNLNTKKIEFAEACPKVEWAGALKRDRYFSFNQQDEQNKPKEIPIVIFNPQYSNGKVAELTESTRLQHIHLLYRAVGSLEWKSALDGSKPVDFVDSSLSSVDEEDSYGYISGVWKFGDSQVQDGTFELLVRSKCETINGGPDEFNFFDTPPARVVIDREKPQLMGSPMPRTDALQIGEPITFDFTEDINCEKPYLFEFHISVYGWEGTTYKHHYWKNDNLLITCQKQSITVYFKDFVTNALWFSNFLRGKSFFAKFKNVVDLVGNPYNGEFYMWKRFANVNLDEASTSFTMEVEGGNCEAPVDDGQLVAVQEMIGHLADISSSKRIDVGRAICDHREKRILAEVTILSSSIIDGRFLLDGKQDRNSVDAFQNLATNIREDTGPSGSGRRLEDTLGPNATIRMKNVIINPSHDDILRNPHWLEVPPAVGVDVNENVDENKIFSSVNDMLEAESLKTQQQMQEHQARILQQLQKHQEQMQQLLLQQQQKQQPLTLLFGASLAAVILMMLVLRKK